jgi:hypothetical protein
LVIGLIVNFEIECSERMEKKKSSVLLHMRTFDQGQTQQGD